jgi:phenylalanyl-tRNA synthetase beta chain
MAPTAGLPSGQGPVRVEIRDSARCPLYTGLAMRSVRIGPSPAWLRTRLAACGLRSINNVVDVTNLVLMERGQPLHAFDRSKIGGGRIVVRFAQRGEKIRTLDEREIVLADEDLVIADQALPVAVAGVMGGADSAVLDSTTQIFLESALFLPSTVRRTSRRHAMITDSSYRFERGVDPGAVEAALERAASLLTQVAGAEAEGGIVREGPGAAARPAVRVRPSRVEAILGTPVADARIGEVLGAIGAAPMHDGDAFVAEPPGHRQDLEREIDFIEEIARIVGYEAIAPALPQVALTPTLLPESVRAAAELRRVLSALGFHEHVAVSFTSEAANARFRGPFDDGASVLVRNPLRSDATALQRSALGALLDALKTNVAARAPRVDLFTIARTFAACGSPQVEQREVVSGLLYGRRPGVLARDERPLVFADVKRVVESLLAVLAPGRSLSFAATDARAEYHPRACAEARLDGQVVGYFGRLHPDVAEGAEIAGEIYVWEVDCREAVAYRRAHPGLQPIPRYPGSERDVSLLVDARTPAAAAVEAVQALGEPAIESITVFDEYTGAGIDSGRKALGYRIVYRAADRTLTEAEVSALHETVLGHLTRRLGATVRV